MNNFIVNETVEKAFYDLEKMSFTKSEPYKRPSDSKIVCR